MMRKIWTVVLGLLTTMLIFSMALGQERTSEGKTEWDDGIIKFKSQDGKFQTRFDVRMSGKFWIVSDESQMIYRWSKKNDVNEQYSLPINKADGVAYNAINGRLYAVSDSEARMYVFSINGG